MPPRQSIILMDAVAIKGAHQAGCWNALRKNFTLHSVPLCVQEATQPNKAGQQLVSRTEHELGAELVLGEITDRMRLGVTMRVGHRTDLDRGERDLLAYALSLSGPAWWICGPDNGTVNALNLLGLLDRMISLESLARASGHSPATLPPQYREQWLADRRTRFLLDQGR